MKKFIILLTFITACSPYQKVQKHWTKIQDEIKKHPEIADSLKIVRHDTIKVTAFRDRLVADNSADTWDNGMFARVDTLATAEVAAKGKDKVQAAVKLQEVVCPDYAKDSTYYQKVYNSKVTLYIPVHITVRAKGGKLSIGINSEPTSIPDPSVLTKVEFKEAHPPFYKVTWFWVALLFLGLLVLTNLPRLR